MKGLHICFTEERCPDCGHLQPEARETHQPRVHTCLACGEPVQSGKRGRARHVHWSCRALLRKLREGDK